jgi:hypothetical protein
MPVFLHVTQIALRLHNFDFSSSCSKTVLFFGFASGEDSDSADDGDIVNDRSDANVLTVRGESMDVGDPRAFGEGSESSSSATHGITSRSRLLVCLRSGTSHSFAEIYKSRSISLADSVNEPVMSREDDRTVRHEVGDVLTKRNVIFWHDEGERENSGRI